MAYLLWLSLLSPDINRYAVVPPVPAIHHPGEPVANRRARRRSAKLGL